MSKLSQNYTKMPKNFMTPNVLKWEQFDDKIIELSEGTGIESDTIYGVTELIEADTRYGLQSTERSEMFTSKKEALKYYSLLKLS